MTSTTLETITSALSGVVLPRLKSETCADRHILVVDDEPITRGIAKVLLEKFGFADIHEAEDGAAALVLLREHKIDLVISDFQMAPVNGVELFRRMRSDRQLRAIPFLMLTASMSHETVRAAKKVGIKHYLLKPFRLGGLQEKLVEIFTPHEHGPRF
jgi:two-component system chemotaxis response regulator CheY